MTGLQSDNNFIKTLIEDATNQKLFHTPFEFIAGISKFSSPDSTFRILAGLAFQLMITLFRQLGISIQNGW